MVVELGVADEMSHAELLIGCAEYNGTFHAVFRHTRKAHVTAVSDLEKRHHDWGIRPCGYCLLQPLISFPNRLSL